jgi:hypothetical protein
MRFIGPDHIALLYADPDDSCHIIVIASEAKQSRGVSVEMA